MFPVRRISRHLGEGRCAQRIKRGALRNLSSVIDYLKEILVLAGNAAMQQVVENRSQTHL